MVEALAAHLGISAMFVDERYDALYVLLLDHSQSFGGVNQHAVEYLHHAFRRLLTLQTIDQPIKS